MGELLKETAETIVDWLAGIGIELALEKSELLIPTRKRTHNTLEIRVKGQVIASRPSVQYLGVHLDQKANFKTHATMVAKRADDATRALRALMPNTGGPRHRARKLLAAVEGRRQNMDQEEVRKEARRKLQETWQTRWSNSNKGEWTRRLIPEIAPCVNGKHGDVNYHLAQAFSGHGCFAGYLKRFKLLPSAECWHCADPNDDVRHTLFECSG